MGEFFREEREDAVCIEQGVSEDDSAHTTAPVGRNKSLPVLRLQEIGWADLKRVKTWRWTREADPIVYVAACQGYCSEIHSAS